MDKKPTKSKKSTTVKNGKKTVSRDSNGQFAFGNSFGTGRPKKGNCVSDLLRSKGEEFLDNGRTRLQEVVEILYTKAEKGDLKAIDMIFDRLEGKAAQKIEVEETTLPTGFDIEIIKN